MAKRFPEQLFPCLSPEYRGRLLRGKSQASRLSAAIFGLARNVESKLRDNLWGAEQIGALFQDYRIFIYENDSTDSTKDMLHAAARDDVRLVVATAECGAQQWPGIRDPDRGQDMAGYRMRNREMALTSEWASFVPPEVCIVLDLDFDGGISVDGVAHSMSFWGLFDCMASNGLIADNVDPNGKRILQYDTWAWREGGWGMAVDSWPIHITTPNRGERLLPLNSAFGGMAIYPSEAYFAASSLPSTTIGSL